MFRFPCLWEYRLSARCGHRCELNSRPLPSSILSGTICSLDIWQTVSIIAKGNFPDIDCSKLFIQIKQWMMEAEKTFYVSVGHQNEPWNARHVVFSHSVLSLLMRLDYQNQASKLQNIVLPRQRKLISWSQLTVHTVLNNSWAVRTQELVVFEEHSGITKKGSNYVLNVKEPCSLIVRWQIIAYCNKNRGEQGCKRRPR